MEAAIKARRLIVRSFAR